LNRLTAKTYPDSTTVNYTYDNDSRLTQVTDATGAYQFTFDKMGWLTATTTQYSFLPSRSFSTSYSYDAASNRVGFTDPEGGASTYAYDALSRRTQMTIQCVLKLQFTCVAAPTPWYEHVWPVSARHRRWNSHCARRETKSIASTIAIRALSTTLFICLRFINKE
jgi:YD repeat-containing protein